MKYELKLHILGSDDDGHVLSLIQDAMILVTDLYVVAFRGGDEIFSMRVDKIDDKDEEGILTCIFNNVMQDDRDAIYQLATGISLNKELQKHRGLYEYIKNVSSVEIELEEK